MAKEFKLPDLGEGLSEATLVDWKVKEGDVIRSDQVLAEVETDKAVSELPSPFAGKVLKLHFKPGDTVPVGAVIVTFEAAEAKASTAGSARSAAAAAAPRTNPGPTPARAATPGDGRDKPAEASRPAAAVAPRTGPVLAAPATRKLARELNVNIELVRGTGPGGRITAEDVRAFAAGGGRALVSEELVESAGVADAALAIQRPMLPDFSQFGQVERQKVSAIRKRIAQRMVISQQTAASVTHVDEADITLLEEGRAQAKKRAEEKGVRLTLLPYLVKAVVAALKKRPVFNASYDDDKQEIVYKKYFHVGIAVDSPQGLLVPVVRDADKKSVADIAREIVDLAERARDGKLTAEQMRGGSFTITNIGAIGGLSFTPVINWPEVAILGAGRIYPAPAIENGQLTTRKKLPLCLTFDHRVIDGADAARFVNDVREYLGNPLLLLLEM